MVFDHTHEIIWGTIDLSDPKEIELLCQKLKDGFTVIAIEADRPNLPNPSTIGITMQRDLISLGAIRHRVSKYGSEAADQAIDQAKERSKN